MDLQKIKEQDKKSAQRIADYLLERVETDELLLAKLNETDKTLKGCINYVKSEAKKQAEDGVAFVTDEEVFEWSVHYFLEDSIKEEEGKTAKKETENGVEEESENAEEVKPNMKKQTAKKKVKNTFVEQLSLFEINE